MCQLMKACLLAFTDTQPVVRAYLHPSLPSVSVTGSPASHNGYRVVVCRERGVEPIHLLDGMDVSRAVPIIYYAIIIYKHHAG